VLACSPISAAHAARVVDQGPVTGSSRCTDVEVDTTCILPFGGPAETDETLVSADVGDVAKGQFLIVRPKPDAPGRWMVIRPSTDAFHFKQTGANAAVHTDTAIRLLAGDRVVLIDPLVAAAGGSVRDFDLEPGATEIGDTLADGLIEPVVPVGRLRFEPDADHDGWGDETQDLCPGVAGRQCSAGTPHIALSGPAYVPSTDEVRVTWTATNAGDSPQPLTLNLWSSATLPRTELPAGTTCAPGRVESPVDAWIPPTSRSPLATTLLPSGLGWSKMLPGFPVAGNGSTTCNLGVLAPGQSVSGSIISATWVTRAQATVRAVLLASTYAATGSPAVAQPSASFGAVHFAAGEPAVALRPYLTGASPISSAGTLTANAACGGLPVMPGCTLTGELRAPVGNMLLGRSVAPVSVATPAGAGTLTLKVSKAGRKWFASHRGKVSVVIVSSLAGETDVRRATQMKLVRSSGFRRKLKKLAARTAKRKHAKHGS
jgi:hypothetical protein